MRKVILFDMVTLDGFFEGPDGDINWHTVDEEFNDFAIDQLNAADGLLFGRVTYELMAGYWPTPAAIENDPVVAGLMNRMPKVVFSKTLDKADWNNTRLVSANLVEEIARLKQQPGKDLLIFGSSDLAATFIKSSLIDEYRIMVSPVVLGKGNPLFKGLEDRLNLNLIRTRVFGNGNVLLCYEPSST